MVHHLYLAAISHVYTIAWREWNWINHNPVLNIKKLKEPRGRVRFLNELERQRLLDTCRESRSLFLYPIVVLALSTGMRRGEILGLKWRDVDFDTKRIVIQETKNDENNTEDYIKPTNNLFEENVAYHVQQAMIKYTSDNSYALCEYLDLDNLINFIYWCKTR